MAGRKKGPEKKKFLVRRPKPSHASGQRDQKPDDATLELSGTESRPNLDNTVPLGDTIEQEKMETYSHHSEPQAIRESRNHSNARLVVARPVVEAWQSPDGNGTFPQEVETQTQPEMLVVGHEGGARRGSDGEVLGHTILGNVQDFTERAPKQAWDSPERGNTAGSGVGGLIGGLGGEQESEGGSEFGGSSMSKSPSQSIASRRRGSVSSAKSGRSSQGKSMKGSTRGSQKGSQKGSQAQGSGKEEAMKEMTFYERSAEERQTKALERYETYERQRKKLYEKFMEGRPGKLQGTVPVVFTGDEFRERREEYDLIDKALPREEKFADSLWFMSLRDSWCRYIPLGSIFSGLFCKVREKELHEKAFTVVRNPKNRSMVNTVKHSTKARDGTDYEYHHMANPEDIPSTSWVQDAHLWDVQKHLKRSIKELLPFRPDSEGLSVTGEDIWTEAKDIRALAEVAEEQAGAGQGKEWGNASNHSGATGKVSKSGTGKEAFNLGPKVEFLEHHLAFETHPDKVGCQKLPVMNTGTSAIYYKWHKAEVSNKLGVPLRGLDPPGGGFYAVEEEGVLLPGNTIEFSFAFKSKLCGIYTSSFHMSTVPPLPAAEAEALTVTMRGVVTTDDQHEVKRQLLEDHLEHNSIVHGIQDILMEAIRKVELPPPAAGAEDQPLDQAKIDVKIYAKANTLTLVKGDVPCLKTQAVYYDKHQLQAFRDLAAVAVDLPQLADVPEPVTELEADAAYIKSLTPRDAVYDPSIEAQKGEEESWDEKWSWSHNVLDLGTRQLGIVSEKTRMEELEKTDKLVEQAVWHAHRPNALYPPALDAVSELAENIEASAAQIRRRMGLPVRDFRDPDDGPAPPREKVEGEPEDDPELEKDFEDTLYLKVRTLLCQAIDQFSDLAAVVMVDEAERRGEDVDED